MSRHSSMGSYQQEVYQHEVYNYPLSEQFLKSQHSQPMIPQHSNRSLASTSSGSYDSAQGSCLSTSPLQYDNFDGRHSVPNYTRHSVPDYTRHSVPNHARHNSQGAAYDTDMCISPLDLHPKNHIESRHCYQNQKVLPSSDCGHIAVREASHNKVVSQKPENRRRDNTTSSNTERDISRRVACEWDGCHATFSRKADVNRHLTSTHKVELIDCDVKNCGRKDENGFARKDHLLEHKRGYHCMDLPKRHIKNRG